MRDARDPASLTRSSHMCLIVALFKVVPGFPLVLAANRDERYSRPGEPPTFWDTPRKIFAGRDPVGGGTWLGVNTRGVAVALSNRRTTVAEDPRRRSRGLLVVDALAADSAASAIECARTQLGQQPYNPFNLLCADPRRVIVLHHADETDRVQELPPGAHVLTTGDVDDRASPKVARAHSLVAKRAPTDLDEAVALLQGICRDHGGGEPDDRTLCMHGQDAGTVSSSVLALDARGNLECYHHVQGPPCRAEYKCVFALA